jgi:hypothetical protein
MRKFYLLLKGKWHLMSLFSFIFLLPAASLLAATLDVGTGFTYATIQDAVTAANPGDVIMVHAGLYTASDIVVNKSLTIQGPNAAIDPNTGVRSAEAIITVGAGSAAAFIVPNSPTPSVYSVTISGFTFLDGSPLQDGHFLYNPANVAADVTFTNNIVRNGRLIYGGYYWRNITINNNSFSENIGLGGGQADAVYILGGNTVNVNDNVINTADVGILVKGELTQIDQINILRNKVSNTQEEGIQIGSLMNNANVQQNVVDKAATVGGIRVYNPQVHAGGKVYVTNNIVTNSQYGFNLTEGDASQLKNVTNNSFDNTNGSGIRNGGTNFLLATCNWYGTTTPVIGTNIIGNVTYTPFLLSGTDVSNTIGFQPTPSCGSITKTEVKCFGGSDGTITFSFQNPPYSYSFNNGAFVNVPNTNPVTISGLNAGNKSLVIKDGSGNTFSTSVVINQPASALVASLSSQQNVKCFGEKTGSVVLGATGGTTPYTFPANTTSLAAGTYTFTVTDANGCSSPVKVTITQPAAALSLTASNITPACSGNNGSVTINASGGTAPYTGAGAFTNLAPGNNHFTVTDKNGCSASIDVNIPGSSACPPQCTFVCNNVYYGGFEGGKGSCSSSCGGGSDLSYGLPRNGSYEIVKSVDELSGGGYLSIKPKSGSYFFAAHTSNDETDRVWYSTVNVISGHTYNFCASVTLLKNLGKGADFVLGVYANGKQIGTGSVNFNWTQICGSYTVPAGTTKVEFSIRDPKKGLFFVAIDDICLSEATTTAPITLQSVNAATTVAPETTDDAAVEVKTDVNEKATVKELTVSISPNPSPSDFQINIQSDNDAPVTLKIIDATGRAVNVLNVKANSIINTGKQLQAGNYYAEVTQGNKRRVIKLVKIK